MMNINTRKRRVYLTVRQRKKLLEFMSRHPELSSGKVTSDFRNADAQKLWITLANECNALPGSRKNWRQWRKTWQDLKSKTKKRQSENSLTLYNLSDAEQETLGIKLENSKSEDQQTTEFVNSGAEPSSAQGSIIAEDECNVSYYEQHDVQADECDAKCYKNPVETSINKSNKYKNDYVDEHSSTCIFNCKLLAKHEQRKIEIKEDYFNFKKDYLRQKLIFMKEQAEALKVIARELANK